MLDGDTIDLGDLMFDIVLQRTGAVILLTPQGGFELDYGAARIIRYAPGGFLAGVRRVYWLQPILSVPQKNDPQWQLLQAVVATLRANPCP